MTDELKVGQRVAAWGRELITGKVVRYNDTADFYVIDWDSHREAFVSHCCSRDSLAANIEELLKLTEPKIKALAENMAKAEAFLAEAETAKEAA